ncbi:MAG: hypothetical protein ABII88_01605 [Candidatus Omnitrophota bacterium]
MKKYIFWISCVLILIGGSPWAFSEECVVKTELPVICMPSYVIQEAEYKGKVEDSTAFIDAKINIEVLDDNRVNVPLFDKNLAIVKTSLPKGVFLLQRSGKYNLIFSGKGNYSINLQFTALIGRKEDRNVLCLGIAPAAVSKLILLFEGTDLDIQSAPEMSTQLKTKGNQTEFIAYPGTENDIKVSWFAKPTALAKAKLLLNSENSTLITVSPGIIHTQTFLNYKIVQGKLSQFEVGLPEDLNLLTVKGEFLKNWDLVKEKGKQVLKVELTKEISEAYQLILEAEQIKEGNFLAPDIVSLNAERENGYVAFVVKDDYNIRSLQRNGVSQLNVGELPDQIKRAAGGEEKISLAYRFLSLPKELLVNVEKIKPEITVRNNVFLDVSEEVMKLFMWVDYRIAKAGVFNFNLELPNDMDVVDVGGENIENWKVNSEGVTQTLEVQLRRKAMGDYRLFVELEKPVKDMYQDMEMPMVNILNADKITGYIGVGCESSIRLKTKHRNKLTEVALTELINIPLPGVRYPALGYKFLVQPYELQLAVEKVDSRVTSDVFTFISVGEGLMLSNSAVTFDVLFAGIDKFSLVLPEDVSGVDITGEGIKAKDEREEERTVDGKIQKIKIYDISLHSKVKGKYTLYCACEKVLKNSSQKSDIPVLEVLGVDRQTGSIAIGPRANVEIELVNLQGASQVDVKEMPQDKITGLDIQVLYALKYVRYPYAVSLEVKKHEDVSVLVAVVESAVITSVMGKDGQIIVDAKYFVKNRSKQYLDIELPKDAAIWSTFVDGKAVKPAKTEEGRVLLPLVKYEEKDRSFPVEIIYETKRPKLFMFGAVSLTAPVFDIPLTNITWNVYLPFGYNYHNINSNMELGQMAFVCKSVSTRERDEKGRGQAVRPSVIAGKSYEKVCADAPCEMELNEGFYGQDEEYGRSDYAKMKKEDKRQTRLSGELSVSQQRQQKDLNFLSNISSQVARYNQQLTPEKTKQIEQGRQKGVLPIHITIPTGGRLFTFTKLISRQPLKVSAIYSKAQANILKLIIFLLIGFFGYKHKEQLKKLIKRLKKTPSNDEPSSGAGV